MAVQLKDRSVMIIDMWGEVYLKDKREDIKMKLEEHENIIKSDDEEARIESMKNEEEKDKAEAARLKEREAIQAINFKLMANGFHSG